MDSSVDWRLHQSQLNWRNWCRLCGALDGTSEISERICFLLENIVFGETLEDEVMRICCECNNFLQEFSNLLDKTRKLERLFKGLAEETDSDLTIPRLNAYRDHFSLSQKIIEENFPTNFEYIEEDECDLVEETEIIEQIEEEEEQIEEEQIQEVVEEIFLEDKEIVDDSIQSEETVFANEISQQNSQSPREKTEDEKFFCFQCHECNEPEFLSMKSLTDHCKTVHNCLPLVKCCLDTCEAILSTWRRLLIHKEKHFPNDSPGKLRCNTCNRIFVSKLAFTKHQESHNILHICSNCGKSFKELKTLKAHEKIHLQSLEARRNFTCLHFGCDMKFITKQAMENHYKVKHERAVSFFCDCGKPFFTKKSLNEHKKVHDNVRNYFCTMCDFKAKTSSSLKVHTDIHQTGENFSCDICNASFSVLRRLKAHLITHSNTAQFSCSYCDSSFKRKKDLRDHENIHTKERPFNCLFCPKTFANAGNCRKHKIKDHGEELKAWETENGVGGRKKLECYQ